MHAFQSRNVSVAQPYDRDCSQTAKSLLSIQIADIKQHRANGLVGGVVGGAGVDAVAPGLRVGGVNLKAAAAIGTEVVVVGGVGPLGVDGGVVVERTLVGGRIGEANNVVEVVVQVGVHVVGADVGGA